MRNWGELPVEIQEKVKSRHIERYGYLLKTAFDDDCLTWFRFSQTIEGGDFWWEVLVDDNHDLFFARYPKQHQPA